MECGRIREDIGKVDDSDNDSDYSLEDSLDCHLESLKSQNEVMMRLLKERLK